MRRLDAASAFYRAKDRRKYTPPRVHPVSLVLTQGGPGRPLGGAPFTIDELPDVDGVPLAGLADIRIAPWLGPRGIFLVDSPGRLPRECLVPAVEPPVGGSSRKEMQSVVRIFRRLGPPDWNR